MTGPLDVALLSPCYWPEVRRGSERFARELSDGLIARGHRPRLITSHAGRPSRTVEDGLPVTRVWRPPAGRLRRRGYEEHLTHVPFSYAALCAGGADVAHALYATDALAAGRWGRRTGRPVVFSLMGIPHRRGLADHRGRMEIMQRAIAEASALVVLTEAAAAACRRWLGSDARVIPPGVNLEQFSPGRPRAAVPTIVCAAAVEQPRKRVGLLVEAFELVRRERPDARLVLSRPADPGLVPPPAPGVVFADLDDRAELADAYRAAWVSVLPSREEAFGLVLAEALACGTPCVGSNEGGIPEVVDRPEIGRLFDGEEPASLATALLEGLELAGDPGTAAACRARAAEFSTDRCTERYLALYRELTGAG
ncbi:MAG TPA: glycosyltransferase family 4 protein [Solirubrobacteraceae bacterium]|nr:glycosyltransferase family 4 protein [Solirubrobacteraceae bacterium]